MVCSMGSLRAQRRSNFVRSLGEDDYGRIWAASEMGIDIINVHTLNIEQVPSYEGKMVAFCNLPVHYIYKSKNGYLWVDSENELYLNRFNKQGSVEQIQKMYEQPEPNDGEKIIAQVDGMLLFNSGTHIISLKEEEDNCFQAGPHPSFLELPFLNAQVQAIYPKGHELWVGTANGLFRFNLYIGTMRSYMHDP